jgi:hypothetical protein
MAFKPKSKDNLKEKKKKKKKRYYKKHKTQKSGYYKIWKKKKINAQICKYSAVNSQQKFGKEKNYIDKANID